MQFRSFMMRTAAMLVLSGFLTGVTCQIVLIPRVGQECGGPGDLPCGWGEFCNYDEGVCGDEDETGVCEVRPVFCTLEYAPVCGCDGETYGNACAAAAAGVSVAHVGECE